MKKLRLLVLICPMLLLSGCWDKVDLNDRAFVIAIGVDKWEDTKKESPVHKLTNENLNYSVSLALPDLQAFSGTGGSDAKTQAVKCAADTTLTGAFGIVDSYSSQKMYLGHSKTIILGKDIASDKDLLRGALDAIERNPDISRKIVLYVSDGKAVDVLEADAPGEPLVGLFVSHYLKNNEKASALIFKQDLEKTVQQLHLNGNAVLPKISVDQGDIQLSGAAVIKDYSVVGYLDDFETRGYLWVNGKGKGAIVTTLFEKKPLSLNVTQAKRKIVFDEEYNKIVCNIAVQLKGNIGEFYFNDITLKDKYFLREVEKRYEGVVVNEIVSMLEKFQKEYKVDGHNFAEMLKKKNYSLFSKYEKEGYNLFEEIEFRVSVDAEISAPM